MPLMMVAAGNDSKTGVAVEGCFEESEQPKITLKSEVKYEIKEN
jgi:hypothetical protein